MVFSIKRKSSINSNKALIFTKQKNDHPLHWMDDWNEIYIYTFGNKNPICVWQWFNALSHSQLNVHKTIKVKLRTLWNLTKSRKNLDNCLMTWYFTCPNKRLNNTNLSIWKIYKHRSYSSHGLMKKHLYFSREPLSESIYVNSWYAKNQAPCRKQVVNLHRTRTKQY